MVKLHFETLAPGMKARLDSPRRLRPNGRPGTGNNTTRRPRHDSLNCLLADAVKTRYNRIKA